MGLGLHIAREIVELHGGDIQVEDTAQPGSRFVVLLPPEIPAT
jgi:signal transduction histidine kinase